MSRSNMNYSRSSVRCYCYDRVSHSTPVEITASIFELPRLQCRSGYTDFEAQGFVQTIDLAGRKILSALPQLILSIHTL
jgi:hypothetical protein